MPNPSITVFRFVAYTLGLLGVLAALPLIAEHAGSETFRENGPVEWYHCISMLTAGAILFAAGYRYAHTRPLLLLLGLVAWMAMVREMDSLLDRTMPVGGWKVPFALLVIAAVAVGLRNRAALGEQIGWFVGTAAFGLLWSGLVVAVVFAQLVGHGEFLRAMLDDHYQHGVKRVVEELLEAMGYTLVLIGSIEAVVAASADRLSERGGEAGGGS